MNYGDVFQKSDLGRQEIKSQSLGILPREARTLLIMIDGKRNYQSYLDTLDNSKMFAEFGGVPSLFELLLGLEYIETLGGSDTNDNANSNANENINTNNNANANATTKSVPIAKIATASSINSQSQSAAPSFDSSIEKEFERTFSGNSPSKNTETNRKSFTSIFKSKKSAASDETIKSDLAIYIEKNAPPA